MNGTPNPNQPPDWVGDIGVGIVVLLSIVILVGGFAWWKWKMRHVDGKD